MNKKGMIALSAIGIICLVGFLIWGSTLTSPTNKAKKIGTTENTSSVATGANVTLGDATEQVEIDEEGITVSEAPDTSSVPAVQNKTKKTTKSSTASKTTDKSEESKSTKSKEKSSTKKSSTNKSSSSKSNTKSSASKPAGSKQDSSTSTKKTYKSAVGGLTITSLDAACSVSGSKATITKAGTYTLAGKLGNGQVIVDTEKTSKVVIICKSMSLTCSNSAPFYVKSADKVTMQLAAGTTNYITDGASYASTTGPDAACYSEEDLTIEGSGSLIVTGKCLDGIASKNDIKIKQGNIQVTAADDGIRGKDGIEITGGTTKVVCEAHALKTTETSQSAKGLVEIAGGTIKLDAAGDGIHATNQIKVTGGNTYIDAKNEGLDTDSSFLMTSGTMVIDGPKSENHKILDCAKGATVNGGTFFGVGSKTMTSGVSGSQSSLFFKAGSEQAKDTTIKLQNSSGKNVYEHKTTRKYQCVIYSAPGLSNGTYTILCNSAKLGTAKVD